MHTYTPGIPGVNLHRCGKSSMSSLLSSETMSCPHPYLLTLGSTQYSVLPKNGAPPNVMLHHDFRIFRPSMRCVGCTFPSDILIKQPSLNH